MPFFYRKHQKMKHQGHKSRGKNKREPVSSTPRRDAREAYHDEYPRDFGPRVAYTVSRYQGGKEMSALRPYKTAPFHPPALLAPYTKINFYIHKPFSDIYSMWYLLCVLKHSTFVIYACAIARPLISRFSTILELFCPLCGSYWYEI